MPITRTLTLRGCYGFAMADPLGQLADDALDHLVHQFARPMDFIRELVQNSIDAGTPRIEVWVDFNPPQEDDTRGVIEIHVDDFGEGMDEAIIDAQLTRMFSSTKEHDLTKIGKFGIGFTSVFAIGPSAVLVHTGRHGESWELLFHPDRSFDKVRLERPVRGTQITVYKSIAAAEIEGIIGELRWVLTFWCEHSDVPILFSDRRAGSAGAGGDEQDAWGGFTAGAPSASVGQSIARPMDLDCDIKVRLERDGIEVVVGYMDMPTYEFFNGGITLVRSTDPDSLGDKAGVLAHLSFKIKSRQLEHTLTRDNVLQDEGWNRAIDVVNEAALALGGMLVDQVAEAVGSQSAALPRLHRFLANECRVNGLHKRHRDFRDKALLRDWRGAPLTPRAVLGQAKKWGAFLLPPDSAELCQRLAAAGVHLLEVSSGATELLAVLDDRPALPADAVLMVPEPVLPSTWTAVERALLSNVTPPLKAIAGRWVTLHLVSLGRSLGDTALPLATLGSPEQSLCRVGLRRGILHHLRLLAPSVLINRDHPMWQVYTTVGARYPFAVRMALTEAIARDCGFANAELGQLLNFDLQENIS
jgi:hypothetical protein